jgi:hypothetical protein
MGNVALSHEKRGCSAPRRIGRALQAGWTVVDYIEQFARRGHPIGFGDIFQ